MALSSLALLALLVLSAAGCGGSDSDAGGGGGGTGCLAVTCATGGDPAFLAPHNEVRAGTFAGVTLSPTPAPALPALTWSQAAADVAQGWANGCNYAHNANRGADGTARGENIAATAPAGRAEVTPDYVVGMWGGEWSDYTYATNTCASGKVCGHYTQLVWRSTLRVGCARASCAVNSPFGAAFPTWDFIVCDYEPPGNWVGQKPY